MNNGQSDIDDNEYFRQEVGEEPDEGILEFPVLSQKSKFEINMRFILIFQKRAGLFIFVAKYNGCLFQIFLHFCWKFNLSLDFSHCYK